MFSHERSSSLHSVDSSRLLYEIFHLDPGNLIFCFVCQIHKLGIGWILLTIKIPMQSAFCTLKIPGCVNVSKPILHSFSKRRWLFHVWRLLWGTIFQCNFSKTPFKTLDEIVFLKSAEIDIQTKVFHSSGFSLDCMLFC